MTAPALAIKDLVIEAETAAGTIILVNGLSLEAPKGSITALIGESGCGKSMTALAIMGLLPPRVRIASGEIVLDGVRIDRFSEEEYLGYRGKKVSMIFQEPMTSLNPLHTVGAQIAEVYRIHFDDSKREATAKAVAMLKKVRIPDPEKRAEQYPHQMSGGMRQRVMIAIALAASPRLLLADEPTTALDVTIQAQILDLLRDLVAEEPETGIILITHDMGVVAETAARMTVMYAGHEVEIGAVRDVFAAPRHPYTKGLLAAIPHLVEPHERLRAIPGQVPRPGERPRGCAFAPRCSFVVGDCRRAPIPVFDRGSVKSRCIMEKLS